MVAPGVAPGKYLLISEKNSARSFLVVTIVFPGSAKKVI
jgi:hypothetical protein